MQLLKQLLDLAVLFAREYIFEDRRGTDDE